MQLLVPSYAIPRLPAALLWAAIILPVPAVAQAQAQDADEGGEHVLVLAYVCANTYGDTPSLSKCLERQNAKADRWMTAIVESYARMAAGAMADLAHGGIPFDQVAQLRKSQRAFELYRQEAATLAGRTGLYGMAAGLDTAMARFALTIERARVLLGICNHPLNTKLADRVDLTIADWCPPAL
jgi:hypothetical protein